MPFMQRGPCMRKRGSVSFTKNQKLYHAKKRSRSSKFERTKSKDKAFSRKPKYYDSALVDDEINEYEMSHNKYSDSEEEEEIVWSNMQSKWPNNVKPLDEIFVTEKQLKKREKKARIAAEAAERAKQEALRDDRDAFVVSFGRRVGVKDDGDAWVKDISVKNLSISARGKELLKDAEIKICEGKRYGLVGPNGMGKSTLLKLLAWRKIPFPKNIDVFLVEQEVVSDDRSAVETVVSGNEELVRLRKEAAALLDLCNDDADGVKKLAEIYEKLSLMGSDSAEAKASKILAGLGVAKEMQGRCTSSFSGGWRMRIWLARALFMQPTLLLLDEPTNHLDIRAALWLEEYLCRYTKTLVVVSHDQDFLNSVCDNIIHLHDMKLHLYRGNFDDFESGCEQRRREINRKFGIYKKQVMAASCSVTEAQWEKAREQAKSLAMRKGTFGEDGPKRWTVYKVKFHFPKPTELPTPLMQLPLVQLIDVNFSYPNQEDFRLSNFDVGINMGTRVAIVGPNGGGKSTILKLLCGDLVPNDGERRRNPMVRIGRYSQHFVDLLKMEETPLQYLLRIHQGRKVYDVIRRLGKFGVEKHSCIAPIVKLSSGQKARVVFTSISFSRPHILVLDEPTNHLDMESIDALADAVDEFSGGVILVSHNSRLISRVCGNEERSEIWVVENGTMKRYPGSFETYKVKLQEEIRDEVNSV